MPDQILTHRLPPADLFRRCARLFARRADELIRSNRPHEQAAALAADYAVRAARATAEQEQSASCPK